jgi:propanol-preferring alcohol dehydrogenase
MRLVAEGRPLQETSVDLPPATGRSAIVKVKAEGVCHSDLTLISGAYDLGEGRKLTTTGGGALLPFTPGHEIAGTVETLGTDSEGVGLKPGDPVVVYPWIGCGRCKRCLLGRENQCEGAQRFLGFMRDGGYAEYVFVPDVRYLVKTEGIGAPQSAPLGCAGITALSSIRMCQLQPNDMVLLIGAGGVGSTAIQIAKKTTMAKVAVADVDDSRLEQASKLGADHVVNTAKTETKELVSGLRKVNNGKGPDAVVDYVGNPRTASLAFRLLGHEGKLVLVGLVGGSMTIPLPMLPILGGEILGNFTGTLDQLHEMVDLARRGEVVPVVSSSYPLSEANEVLARLEHGEIRGRAVLVP